MLSKKGQLDEINPIYILLAILGGLIAYFVASRAMPDGKFIPILSGILSIFAVYFYLVFTER